MIKRNTEYQEKGLIRRFDLFGSGENDESDGRRNGDNRKGNGGNKGDDQGDEKGNGQPRQNLFILLLVTFAFAAKPVKSQDWFGSTLPYFCSKAALYSFFKLSTTAVSSIDKS